ncbi:hypothetical protein BBJ28_00012060 [Nothophytophthora sp. Chile5]|nr:hypothetical protein BBJ28_00012060 [Nothophytophthora sp. Chile5]
MWSVGCIFAELLSMQVESCPRYQERVPLFPGRSCFPLSADRPTTYSDKLDQLNVIFNVIGTPGENEIGSLGEVKQYLRKLPKKDPRDLREVDKALAHPFLESDTSVRLATLQKLRKIAAVETSHFPVRNTRRFLQCVRRRIVAEGDRRVAVEALRLIGDVMGSLGDNVDQLLSSILPHLIPNLPNKCGVQEKEDEALLLHEETFQVFRKYVNVSNDLQAVTDLLVNVGLAHGHGSVREASLLVVMRLLDERYQKRRSICRERDGFGQATMGRGDKALIVALMQATIPALEDAKENVVVAAEETIAKLELYWGKGFAAEVMQFLSIEDRKTLHEHRQPIADFLDACAASESPPASPSLSSRPTSASSAPNTPRGQLKMGEAPTSRPLSSSKVHPLTQRDPLRCGFLSADIMTILTTNTSNSNADWKRRAVAVEQLFLACKQVDADVLCGATTEERSRRRDDLEELFDVLVRLTQDVDVHLVKRALQITQLLFHKLSSTAQRGAEGEGAEPNDDSVQRPKSRGGTDRKDAAFFMAKMLAPVVETAASFAGDDGEMESFVYTLLDQVFCSGCVSVSSIEQVLAATSLRHRRLQVREEALKVWMVLLLLAGRQEFLSTEYTPQSKLVQMLGRLLGDTSAHVRVLALETAAVLATVCRCNIYALLESCIDDEYVAERLDWAVLRARLRQKHVPELRDNSTLRVKSPAPVNSKDRHARGTSSSPLRSASVVDQSLDNISELRMMAGTDKPANSQSGNRVRHSHAFDPGTGSSSSSSSSAVSYEGSGKKLVGGSLSDRSYFEQQKMNADGSTSYREGSTGKSGSDEDVGDKLSALKKKMDRLRRAPPTKRLRRPGSQENSPEMGAVQDKGSLGEPLRTKQQIIRSESSPEHASGSHGEFGSPSLPRERGRHNTVAISPRISDPFASSAQQETQHSPQHLQSLQSSALSYEDRPLKSKFIEHNARAAAEANVSSSNLSLDDRPIRPMASEGSGQFSKFRGDEYSPGDEANNSNERMRSPTIRKHPNSGRLAEGSVVKVSDQGIDGLDENELTQESAPKRSARPISLATRKRLEAKAKQDAQVADSNRDQPISEVLDRQDVEDESEVPAKKRGSKKPSFMKTASAFDDKARPSGLGKQEPRYLEPHEIKPLVNAKQELSNLLLQLRSNDWEGNFEALSTVRRLAGHHSSLMDPGMQHAIVAEILKQVPNLRSSVAKNALLALEAMCAAFERAMDGEVDNMVPTLLRRCADSNTFVCESAVSSLHCVAIKCSTARVVAALTSHLDNKAVPIRREVARGMHALIVGQAEAIPTGKDLPAILQAVGRCLADSHNEVRDAAKQSVLYLHYEQNVSGARLKKLLPAAVHGKVDQLLGGKASSYTPSTLPASTAAASGLSSSPIITEKRNVKAKPARKKLPSANPSPPSSSNGARKPVDTEELARLELKLDSGNWKDRFDALNEVTEFICGCARGLVDSGKLLGLFDVLAKRMDDGNAKVNVLALECLEKVVPALGNGMEQVLSSFVPAVTKSLAANNPRLSALAQSVVQVLCSHVDARLLCQYVAVQARHSNSRVKPLLLDTLTKLTAQCSDDKGEYALNRYVLPLALELLKEPKSGVKEANAVLIRQLHAALGTPAVLTASSKLNAAQQEKLAAILGPAVLAKERETPTTTDSRDATVMEALLDGHVADAPQLRALLSGLSPEELQALGKRHDLLQPEQSQDTLVSALVAALRGQETTAQAADASTEEERLGFHPSPHTDEDEHQKDKKPLQEQLEAAAEEEAEKEGEKDAEESDEEAEKDAEEATDEANEAEATVSTASAIEKVAENDDKVQVAEQEAQANKATVGTPASNKKPMKERTPTPGKADTPRATMPSKAKVAVNSATKKKFDVLHTQKLASEPTIIDYAKNKKARAKALLKSPGQKKKTTTLEAEVKDSSSSRVTAASRSAKTQGFSFARPTASSASRDAAVASAHVKATPPPPRKPLHPKADMRTPARTPLARSAGATPASALAAKTPADLKTPRHYNYTPYRGPLPPLNVESSFAPKSSQVLDRGARTAPPARGRIDTSSLKTRPQSAKGMRPRSSTGKENDGANTKGDVDAHGTPSNKSAEHRESVKARTADLSASKDQSHAAFQEKTKAQRKLAQEAARSSSSPSPAASVEPTT